MQSNVDVVSQCRPPFRDRIEAGDNLGVELSGEALPDPVILGIPRGGLVIAQQIARRLKAPIDIVLAHKLGAPGRRELAIGAVDEHGHRIVDEHMRRSLHIDDVYLQAEQDRQTAGMMRRKERIRKIRPKVKLTDKTVILTDDGAATGATMQAAVWAVQREQPRTVIVALPVASESALEKFAEDADRVCCLHVPYIFYAVGQFYRHFGEVSDEEVREILKEFNP